MAEVKASTFIPTTTQTAAAQKERILYILLLLFFFSLYAPAPTWAYNVCMWLLFVYSFIFNTLAAKWKLLKNRPAVCCMILFFLVNLISGLLSANTKEGISWIGIRISLLAFPVALGTLYINRLLKERIFAGFVAATACAALFCIGHGIFRALHSHDASLLYNDNLSEIINLQSIYFAMLINLALVIFGYLKITKSVFVKRYVWWLVICLFLPVHFLLASRMAIIVLYSIVFIAAFYLIIYKRKFVLGAALATGLLLTGSLLVLMFPKTLNRFREIGYTHFDYKSTAKESHFNAALTPEQWNGANIRIAVWACAWTVTRSHLLFGTGLGDKMDMLKKQYAEKGFVFGIQSNRNVHNAYLDTWMSLGLVGLLLFLAGYVVLPVTGCIRTTDWCGLLITLCLFVALFTESYLDRTMGSTIVSFFASFLLSYKKPAAVTVTDCL